MAVVYRARQVLLDREVALKVLNPQLAQDPVYAQRFLQEARMLASLSHPHIVPVYDVGVTPDGLHYFSMQMIRRGDFARRLRDGIDEVELVRVLIAVAQALGFAHARGYVHRDVTPANILFDEQNKPVLTDFGIARALAATSRMTASGLSIGTSHYMSPEQARGGEVDRRSDIYSLGVLCFEALSGKPPYDGEDGFAVAYAHVHEPIPTLPEDLAKWQPLIDKCMAKAPDQRFPDCNAFIEGLRGIAASEFETLIKQHGPAALGFVPAPVPVHKPESKREAKERAKAAAIANKPAPPPKVPKPPKPPREPRPPGAPSRVPLYIIGAVIAVGLAIAGIGLFRGNGGAAPSTASRPANTPATPVASTPGPRVPAPAPRPALAPPNGTPVTDPDALPSGDEFALVPDIDVSTLPTVIDPVVELLSRGRLNMQAQRYTTPPGNNALDRYALALVIEPGNADAIAGVSGVAQYYVDQAKGADADTQADAWAEHLATAERIATEHELAPIATQIDTLRKARATVLVERGNVALRSWDTATAQSAFEAASKLDPGSKAVAQGLREAARVGKPGYVFRDAAGEGNGPELIVVGKLALGRREVSVGEFRSYWNVAGKGKFGGDMPSCRDRESIFRSSRKRSWSSPDFTQTDAHPVVCINAAMADGYAAWLSERTGKRYRLPKAAELTANGAGFAKECKGNVRDAAFRKELGGREGLQCDDGHAWTAPGATFAAENAGLYDTGGNVREWVGDCQAGNCRERQAVGASWASDADDKPVRAFAADAAFNTIGFRVAREID